MKKETFPSNTNKEHKRDSAIITTVIMVLVLLLMFVFGLTSLNPPPESGIAVNFGTTDTGSGNVETKDALKPDTAPTETEEVEEPQETEPETEEQPETTPEETETEEVLTQNNEEAIAIKKAADAKKKADKEAKEAKAEADRVAKEKREAEEKAQKERDKKKADLDAMMNGVNNADGKEEEGEGPDDGKGNKGDPNGDPYAASYYGAPGSGTGGQGGFGLNGRSKISGNPIQQNCNEYGRVVVEIEVDKSGKITKIKAGAKGSTNTADCLIEAAEKTARTYKWNADDKAPIKQVGFIVINFKSN
ncbi:hypothetical protein IMCC3317_20480 [Kordia antarctica]|uniref:Energy transducer TonB n=1 Tax=Kordia antarctica TaxID=1218801 RepID=A0A7L4ZIZ6_9FLAO|nr:energy transducer TonB [Kordia antarctica]QHI36683.1 hypothetical protein IMCC3317_20480 [Kordia antarctica]